MFSIDEVRLAVQRVCANFETFCDVKFVNSASGPSIMLYTSSTYYVQGYGYDRWWAVNPYTSAGRFKTILNTSARMRGRWTEVYGTDPPINALVSLIGHEWLHGMLATTKQMMFPAVAGSAEAKALSKKWGKPVISKVDSKLSPAVSRSGGMSIVPYEQVV